MTIRADLSAARDQYACETRRRIGHTISELAAIRWAEGIDAGNILRSLGEQATAAQTAGFPAIARLCRNMEEYLGEACQGEEARLVAVATSLLDSCRTIQMHAEAVANSMRCFGDDGAFHPDTERDADHHTLPVAAPG